ncbi:MAG TPA: hypothetical protein VFU35_08690, partial [Jatrophihabitans sp.]|nr:hypothetical protein [Jatrophihabitans sp.]
GTAVPARFARAPVSTAIGDPPSTDLCSAVDVSDFAQPGYRPAFADSQFPPGCTIRLTKSDGSHVSVSLYGTTSASGAAPGRTTKRVAGLTVYYYPFKSDFGECERDVLAGRIVFTINAFTPKGTTGATPDRTVNCTATDLLTTKIALAVSARALTPLHLATPSVISLDSCRIARAAGWTAVPAFAGAPPTADAFGAGCSLTSSRMSVYLDPMLAKDASVDNARPVSADGHQIYASTSNDASDCALTSVQGDTPDGRSEQLYLSAYATKTVPQFCQEVTAAFGRYLTVAGLR